MTSTGEKVSNPIRRFISHRVADLGIMTNDSGRYSLVAGLPARPILEDLLAHVRERSVPKVVSECSHPNATSPWIITVKPNGLRETSSYMSGANTMLKPRMSCPGVYEMGHGELLYPTEALERAGADNLPFFRMQKNEPVYGVPDDGGWHFGPSNIRSILRPSTDITPSRLVKPAFLR